MTTAKKPVKATVTPEDIAQLRMDVGTTIEQVMNQMNMRINQMAQVSNGVSVRTRCLELAIEKNGGVHADVPAEADTLVEDAKVFEEYISNLQAAPTEE